MKKLKPHRIVHIVWQDSRNIERDWGSRKRTIKTARRVKVMESAGLLIDETKDHFLLALDYDPETDQVHSAATIPKGMVKKVRELRR